jgi:hypothetical protein
MNETAERVWGAGLSRLRPTWLIDRLLDAIENLRIVLMPAQAGGLSGNEMQFETDLYPRPADRQPTTSAA